MQLKSTYELNQSKKSKKLSEFNVLTFNFHFANLTINGKTYPQEKEKSTCASGLNGYTSCHSKYRIRKYIKTTPFLFLFFTRNTKPFHACICATQVNVSTALTPDKEKKEKKRQQQCTCAHTRKENNGRIKLLPFSSNGNMT